MKLTRKEILEKLGTEIMRRDMTFARDAIDEEARTVDISFSSEYPVSRWYGMEVLSHDAKDVTLDRLNDGAPFLFQHDWDNQIGVIESAKIDKDKVGRAKIRFSRSAAAQDIFQDIVDGIRNKISVGYRVLDMILVEEKENEAPVYRVTSWEPYEISTVSIPADPSVGVGREDGELKTLIENANNRGKKMEEDDVVVTTPAAPAVKPLTQAERDAEFKAIRVQEDNRIKDLRSYAEDYPQLAPDIDQFVREGKSVEDFRAHALAKLKGAKPLEADSANIGMDNREIENYSIIRAVNAAVTKNWKGAGLEREVSDAIAERQGKPAHSFYIPHDVLGNSRFIHDKRVINYTSATQGQTMVGTDHLGGSFIELLRNRAIILAAGAQVLDGLIGNVDIPKMTGGALFYWIDNEAGDTTESTPTFGSVTLSPKTVSGKVGITRRMMLQSSPGIEQVVRGDFITGQALAVDLAGLAGSGAAGQPTGVLNTTGIGDVPGGTNGAAMTWAHVVDLEKEVAIDNADLGTLAYITNTKVRASAKKTEMFSGSNGLPIWEKGAEPLNGYRAHVTNQVPSNLTKGTGTNLSANIFGNWADLFVGMWGELDIKVDEVTTGDRGGVILRVFQDVDIAVRHAESFAAMQDIIAA